MSRKDHDDILEWGLLNILDPYQRAHLGISKKDCTYQAIQIESSEAAFPAPRDIGSVIHSFAENVLVLDRRKEPRTDIIACAPMKLKLIHEIGGFIGYTLAVMSQSHDD